MASKDTESEYAFWSSPDQSFTVTYSLEQFHEIDLQVTEAYRRIPRGGIEIGGLLFGRNEPDGVRVQAFRPIACEHATGPTFILSERDLDELEKQIGNSASDPELAGMEVVGWFIAHTRTPFQVTDREAALFDRFFPTANQVTVLVKPERFQPTRFGFLFRNPDGSLQRDGAENAIILPLPGRSGRGSDGPIASIPAPAEKAAPPTPVLAEPSTRPAPPLDDAAVKPFPPKASEPEPPSPAAELSPVIDPRAVSDVPTPPLKRDATQERRRSNGQPQNAGNLRKLPPGFDTELTTVLTTIPKRAQLPSINEIRRRRSDRTEREPQKLEYDSRAYNARLVLALLLAAALGCGVGFWAYWQLPAPVVPLAVHPEASDIVITWPTEQTRRASNAAIRLNDGPQQALSFDEKTAGAVRIPGSPGSNFKLELIVQHWLRDSRGIVRYISTGPAAPGTAEQQQLNR